MTATYYKCNRHRGDLLTHEYCVSDGTHTPVAVIDPEDREQLERLLDSLRGMSFAAHACGAHTCLSSALREFAGPKPPKPEEPTDPAVRVFAEGTTWAKVTSWWVTPAMDEAPRMWDWLVERDDFCVLSEGVTE